MDKVSVLKELLFQKTGTDRAQWKVKMTVVNSKQN